MLSSALKHKGAQSLVYLHSVKTSNRVKHITHWVVADLAHPRGRSLVTAAVNFLADPEDEFEPAASRVALLLAPARGASVLDVAVAAAMKVGACRSWRWSLVVCVCDLSDSVSDLVDLKDELAI